jgi:Putative amidoligase enzyme
MITPLFVAFAGSRWRRHVEATWRYLQNSYKITDNLNCGTHIHVSVEGGYSLEEIKRVAQATVHFEPAFEALVPEHRTSRNIWTRSSWLGSPDLAAKDLSRAGCIQLIEEASDFLIFLGVMHPDSIGGYSWNFTTIKKHYTIEFRKPPASKAVEEALGWAELAMNFVQASLRFESPDKLREFPPTVGGLRRFLQKYEIEGLNEPARLQCIFKDKDPNAFALVKPTGINMKKSQMATIERVIAAERSVIESVIRNKS